MFVGFHPQAEKKRLPRVLQNLWILGDHLELGFRLIVNRLPLTNLLIFRLFFCLLQIQPIFASARRLAPDREFLRLAYRPPLSSLGLFGFHLLSERLMLLAYLLQGPCPEVPRQGCSLFLILQT